MNCSIKIIAMSFEKFIERKFVEWQGQHGKRKTVAEYAAYLGISQPLLTMWMNGSKKPGSSNIQMLYELYGNDVLIALGKDPDLHYIQSNWENYDELQRLKLREMAGEYSAKKKKKK